MKFLTPTFITMTIVALLGISMLGLMTVTAPTLQRQAAQSQQSSSSSSVSTNWNTPARQAIIERMAIRLKISPDLIRKELAAGKTMIQIISEHRIDASVKTETK